MSVCVFVCVSGPCPPCPQMVSVSCLCGKSSRVPRRCSAKAWTCTQICGQTLPCRTHTCANTCHAGITRLHSHLFLEQVLFRHITRYLSQASAQRVRGSVCRRVRVAGGGRSDRVPVRSGTVTRCVPLSSPGVCVMCAGACLTADPCVQVCGRPLSCGNHTCERVCHAGVCGGCPRAGNRSCSCGKTSKFTHTRRSCVPIQRLQLGQYTCI